MLPPHGPLLAIDCSTELLCLAVAGPLGRRSWVGPGGSQASGQLLERARALLEGQGASLGSLSAVAFGRGPGAFTGLRTACAVAQGLSFGARCPVLPVDSLLIVAEGWRLQCASRAEAGPATAGQTGSVAEPFDVGVVMDARMGEVYAGRYRWAKGAWQELQAPMLATPAGVGEAWRSQPPAWLAGNGWGLLPEMPAGCRGAEQDDGARAEGLLSLALQAVADPHRAVKPAQALPLYLRDKVALTTAERAQAIATPPLRAAAQARGLDSHGG